jgi:hypothetical protein
MNSRETDVRAARQILSDTRLMELLSVLEKQEDQQVLAVKFLCRSLRSGETLDGIFQTGSDYGYHLSVRQVSESRFRVGFGCQVEMCAGDGGEWDVVFAGDQVVTVSLVGRWIS